MTWGTSQSQSNSSQGIRYGWACCLARSPTIILFQYLIISSKKLDLSTLISCTILWKPPNHALVISAAEELNLHLSPTIKPGKSARLHLWLQSSSDSLCFDFIWNTSTGNVQLSKWVSPILSMRALTWQLLSWKITPGNEVLVGKMVLWKTCIWIEYVFMKLSKVIHTHIPLGPSDPYIVAYPRMTPHIATQSSLLWVWHLPKQAQIFMFPVSGFLGWVSNCTSTISPNTKDNDVSSPIANTSSGEWYILRHSSQRQSWNMAMCDSSPWVSKAWCSGMVQVWWWPLTSCTQSVTAHWHS